MNRFLLVVIASLALNFAAFSQSSFDKIDLSGWVIDSLENTPIPFSNVAITDGQQQLVAGALTNDEGLFELKNIRPGNYTLHVHAIGFVELSRPIFVGAASNALFIGKLLLQPIQLSAVEIEGRTATEHVSAEKQSYSISDNISQSGGSVLQALQNLPGITADDGKIMLRGNDKVAVLVDGKQTALTGFSNAQSLDNIPASSIERIEVIANPSSRYDANGNAGIINIIYKKNSNDGWHGKLGFNGGLGALWVRRENYPGIRSQYVRTPKVNPTFSLDYNKNKWRISLQGDYLYTETLNKNEFTQRNYDNGPTVLQQLKRNRNTSLATARLNIDRQLTERDELSFSSMFSSERILDRGDEPFYQSTLENRVRLWQFLEDELKTSAMGSLTWVHKYAAPGRQLKAAAVYNFHRENEKYFFDNIFSNYTGHDAFKLISDENVLDLSVDYERPLKFGKLELGGKYRYRVIPTNMLFIPGQFSPLDTNAGGWATYREKIPAVYANYSFDTPKWDGELGVRGEYVALHYDVNPLHDTYKSNGYSYLQPFPSARLGRKFGKSNKLVLFYNRRVDRPNEVDIRVFPKYDDAEIVKVGNPSLRPQFTDHAELGFKRDQSKGYLYAAAFANAIMGTITRIGVTDQTTGWIFNVSHNAGRSYQAGVLINYSRDITTSWTINASATGYLNRINAFNVLNLYPTAQWISIAQDQLISGNVKVNANYRATKKLDAQISARYLAPDLIPQGRTNERYAVDGGLRWRLDKKRGELTFNVTDLFNTLKVGKTIYGQGFTFNSLDYGETQVWRLGYQWKF